MTTAKSEQLSKEDEERLKDLFHKLDRNKDGQIDIDDLSAVFKSSSKSVESQTKVNSSRIHCRFPGILYLFRHDFHTLLAANKCEIQSPCG